MHDLWNKNTSVEKWKKKIHAKKWHFQTKVNKEWLYSCQHKSKSPGKDMTYVQRSNS